MEIRKPKGFDERLQHSIELLQKAEKLAMRYDATDGFYLAFSGGKDIDEIIDNYVQCDDPELRKMLKEKMTAIRDKHQIDNVKIGYKQ